MNTIAVEHGKGKDAEGALKKATLKYTLDWTGKKLASKLLMPIVDHKPVPSMSMLLLTKLADSLGMFT